MMSADSNVSDEESSVDISNGEIATSNDTEISDSSNSPTTTTPEVVEGDAKSLHNNEETDSCNTPNLEPPISATTAEPAPNDENNNIDPTLQKQSMELNVALESLESMRRLNIELEFGGSPIQVQHDRCTYCQREALQKLKTNPPPPNPPQSSSGEAKSDSGGINIGSVKLDGSRMRRFGSNVGSLFSKSSSSSSSNIDKMGDNNNNSTSSTSSSTSRRNILKKTHHPCLTCGHPTCSAHSSSNFSKNKIQICQPCAYLFELDFLVDTIASTADNTDICRRKVDDMVDCYDRAKILLLYTAQYANDIASALETNTVRSNKIGAGSSATGIVSGVAGVVGCGALLFPPVAAAGVPLLIASLVFGGGATAAQTGDAAVKYFSEPNKLAEKMVALHGMVLSLLRITEVLSYGLLKHLNVNYSVEHLEEGEGEDEMASQREQLAKEINVLLEKHGVSTTTALKGVVNGGIVATEMAAVGGAAEAAVSTAAASGASVVGRSSRYFGRVGTTAANSARFIPLAGGLLSAACLVVEGRELKKTMQRIREGNPCAMAEQVRSIADELDMLPDSTILAAECRRVFELAKKEKSKKATSAKDDSRKRDDTTIDNVDHGDISDIIDVLDTTAKVQDQIVNEGGVNDVHEGGDMSSTEAEVKRTEVEDKQIV